MQKEHQYLVGGIAVGFVACLLVNKMTNNSTNAWLNQIGPGSDAMGGNSMALSVGGYSGGGAAITTGGLGGPGGLPFGLGGNNPPPSTCQQLNTTYNIYLMFYDNLVNGASHPISVTMPSGLNHTQQVAYITTQINNLQAQLNANHCPYAAWPSQPSSGSSLGSPHAAGSSGSSGNPFSLPVLPNNGSKVSRNYTASSFGRV